MYVKKRTRLYIGLFPFPEGSNIIGISNILILYFVAELHRISYNCGRHVGWHIYTSYLRMPILWTVRCVQRLPQIWRRKKKLYDWWVEGKDNLYKYLSTEICRMKTEQGNVCIGRFARLLGQLMFADGIVLCGDGEIDMAEYWRSA